MANNYMIFAGAIPAALLALVSDFLLGHVERKLMPVSQVQQGGSS